MPKIVPQKTPDYEVKQSPTEILPTVPFRIGAYGPGNSGKTVMLSSMILDKDKYRGVFSRIYIWSPSIKVDDSWGPVRNYIKNELGHDEEKEGPCFFEEFNGDDMRRIAKKAQKITELLKTQYKDKNHRGPKTLFSILIIVDDCADDPRAVHKAGGVLESAFVRFRHFQISTIVSSQSLKIISPVIRKNMTVAFFFRIRNMSEMVAGILEEFSALVDKHELFSLYRAAVAEPFQLPYIDFLARDIKQMFYTSFEARLIPPD